MDQERWEHESLLHAELVIINEVSSKNLKMEFTIFFFVCGMLSFQFEKTNYYFINISDQRDRQCNSSENAGAMPYTSEKITRSMHIFHSLLFFAWQSVAFHIHTVQVIVYCTEIVPSLRTKAHITSQLCKGAIFEERTHTEVRYRTSKYVQSKLISLIFGPLHIRWQFRDIYIVSNYITYNG
jgi:hypothetical protein